MTPEEQKYLSFWQSEIADEILEKQENDDRNTVQTQIQTINERYYIFLFL